MATPHAPCWDGWQSDDMTTYDGVWRIDFSVHFFTNGRVACSLLPICTVDGADVAATDAPEGIESLITVIVTSSPVRSNPSTRMLLECLASLDRNGGLEACRKVIMCDGFKVRKRSDRKLGVITDEEVVLYRAFLDKVACLCRKDATFRRTRLVRLARRQGSAFAIREAIQAHVRTPFVIIVPHDCIIARSLPLVEVASAMHAHPGRLNYVKLVGPSMANYAETVRSQYGVLLQPTTEFGKGIRLIPMLRYMDNVSMVSVRFLKEKVFIPGSGVRRGTFIEDTFGKQTQMQEWLTSEARAAKMPPCNGCFFLADGVQEPMMRHLDGKTYMDPEQRALAGFKPYPTDWTAKLKRTPSPPTTGEAPSGHNFLPLREAICWEALGSGCTDAKCTKLHPMHNGAPVCDRHATTALELWGRRKRPPCPGDCGRAHPTRDELEVSLAAAVPEGSRLHAHVQSPPRFGGDPPLGASRSLYVASPSHVSPAEADAELASRAPMALRVAIDVGFDHIMSEGERKSLATQCGLCHGIASEAENRPHVSGKRSQTRAMAKLLPILCHPTHHEPFYRPVYIW